MAVPSIALLIGRRALLRRGDARTYSCGRDRRCPGVRSQHRCVAEEHRRCATLATGRWTSRSHRARAEVDRVLGVAEDIRSESASRGRSAKRPTRSSSDSARRFTMGWVRSSWPSRSSPGVSPRPRASATSRRDELTGSRCSRAVRSVPVTALPRPLACERGAWRAGSRLHDMWTVSMTPTPGCAI